MFLRYAFLGLLLASAPALADCPPGRDTSDTRATLHTQLLNAPNELAAAQIADRIWQIWLTAPDEWAQDLLNRGMERRQAWDLEMSEALLDKLITYCPDYTEGYNQRAFSRFLRQDFDGALADIDRVLDSNPYHFGALSGKALTLFQQGRAQLAQQALREAVAVHPFLRERHLLATPDQEL